MGAFTKHDASTTRRKRSRLRGVDFPEGEERYAIPASAISLIHTRFQPGDWATPSHSLNRFNGFQPRSQGKPLKRLVKTNGDDAATRLKPGENESVAPFSP